MQRHTLLPDAHRSPHNGALLAVLILLIVASPLPLGHRSELVVELLLDLVLITAAYSAAARGGRPLPFLGLTVLTLGSRWAALLLVDDRLMMWGMSITVVWVAVAVAVVVKALFEESVVTTNMIFGAVVAYLLIAVAFAFLFQILEISQPGAFTGLSDSANPRDLGDSLLYFSLVCLTTMGYGDILPVSDLARPLAALEGVFGSLYLAVMIARLVGLHIHGDPASGTRS